MVVDVLHVASNYYRVLYLFMYIDMVVS